MHSDHPEHAPGERHTAGDAAFSAKPQVVVRTDGGICSQLAFYAYGLELESRGFDVCYDTSWFDEYGKDVNGIQVRNYDLEKACPSLKTKRCDAATLQRLKTRHAMPDALCAQVRKSAYVSGYPDDRSMLFIKYADVFRKAFRPVDVELCQEMEARILSRKSCAVHVRRGDLAQYDPAYGWPTPVEYFLKAIEMVAAWEQGVTFYFFSDGMDFVREEILPRLGSGVQYELVDAFGADKGYLDLYLMARADYIISSQGSFGYYAKMLSEKNPPLFAARYSDLVAKCPGCIYLNYEVRPEDLVYERRMSKANDGVGAAFKRFFYSLMLSFAHLPFLSYRAAWAIRNKYAGKLRKCTVKM